MTEKLVAEEGPLKGLVLSFEEGEEWLVGRDPDSCQLLVEEPAVSRKHLRCRSTDEGIVIENLSTTNPTLINGKEFKEPTLIQNGDTLMLGSGVFRFYSATEAEVIQPEEEKASEEAPVEPEPEEEVKPEVKVEEREPEEEEPEHESIYEEEEEVPEEKKVLADIDFDLLETGRFLLKVISGPNNGAEFSMQVPSSFTIGTDPKSCDIIFHDTSVSRRHARVTVNDDTTIYIEDLGSKNGTHIEGDKITGRTHLDTNTIVSMGTTAFVIYDREGDIHTIVSPLLPSIVKTLQKEEEEKERAAAEEVPEEVVAETPEAAAPSALGAFILIAIITGLFVVVGIGTTTLFQAEPVTEKRAFNVGQLMDDAISPFSSVRFSFNRSTGSLLLVGHVITPSEKNQLMYNLQGLDFIRHIDDSGIVIDEYVWREMNQVLAKNPKWKGINIHSPLAGKFVISGYLKTRTEAKELSDYITGNFRYLDLLEKRIIVEEDVVTSSEIALQNLGIRTITVEMENGELSLTGNVARGKMNEVKNLIKKFKAIPGVRNVKNFITEVALEESMINITNRYEVTGFSRFGANVSVVVNGRILTSGDILDNMTIIKISGNAIFLEKDDVKYRINYNQ